MAGRSHSRDPSEFKHRHLRGLCNRPSWRLADHLLPKREALGREGAIEYGRRGTAFLTGISVLYAASAIVEGALQRVQFDAITVWGIAIHAFSMVMLFYVIYELRDIWTVKILIARDHRLVTSWLFRNVKHSNYFLT